MPGERPRRVAEQLQRLLSSRLIPALRDPRLVFMTVTSVVISRDLKSARVYVSLLEPNPARRKNALAVLNGAVGRFRREIGRELRLRHTPTLQFDEDTSVERADRIERLILEIHGGADAEDGTVPAPSEDDESE